MQGFLGCSRKPCTAQNQILDSQRNLVVDFQVTSDETVLFFERVDQVQADLIIIELIGDAILLFANSAWFRLSVREHSQIGIQFEHVRFKRVLFRCCQILDRKYLASVGDGDFQLLVNKLAQSVISGANLSCRCYYQQQKYFPKKYCLFHILPICVSRSSSGDNASVCRTVELSRLASGRL